MSTLTLTRSPRYIRTAALTNATYFKLELFIFTGVIGSKPATATYTINKDIINSEEEVTFEINQLVRDYYTTGQALWVIADITGFTASTVITPVSTTFLAFDGFNYSTIYSVDVEVTNDGANRRPTASIKSNIMELYTNDEIVFSGNSSSDDSEILKYQFNFGDGKETGWLTDSWVEYYYEEAGEYEVKLQVEDDEGVRSSSADSIIIKVSEKPQNSKPVAVISSPQVDSVYQSNSNIQFSAQGSFDSDDDELLFTWSSSIDGQFYETSLLFFQFPLSEGVHIITLIVSDTYLSSDSVSTQITVTVSDKSFDDQNPLLPSLGILPTTIVLVLVTFLIRRRI